MQVVVENMRERSLKRPKEKKEKHKSKSKKKKRSRTGDDLEYDVDSSQHQDPREGSGDIMTSSSAMESQTQSMTTSEATSFIHESFGSSQTSSLNPASTSREAQRSLNHSDLLLAIEAERRATKKTLKKQSKKEKKLAKRARREALTAGGTGSSLLSLGSQSRAEPSGASTSIRGSRRNVARGGGSSVVSDITIDMEAQSAATSRTQFHHGLPFETIAEESKNSGSATDNGSGEDNAWATSTTGAFPTESEDRKLHVTTLMERPTTPKGFDNDGFPISGFSPMPPTPDNASKRRLGTAASYANDSNPSLFEDELHISDRERRLASVKPQFSKSTESFPSPSQMGAYEGPDRKKAASPLKRRGFAASRQEDENDWAPPKRPSHTSSSARSSARKNSRQGSSNTGSGTNSADIDKWEVFGYDATPSPMKSSTRESSDGNRGGGHGSSVGSNSTLSTRKTHEDPVARKAAEAAGRRSSLEERYHAQGASATTSGGPPIGTDPRSQELLIMYLKAMGTDARSAAAIAHTFSAQQKLAEEQGLVGDDDESASAGGADIPLSQIYAIMDESKAHVGNEGGSKGSDLTPADRTGSVATASAQSAKAAEATRGSRTRPRETATPSPRTNDDVSMGSISTAAERPSQDVSSRGPIRSRSRRRNESSTRSRSTSRDQRRNGRGRGRRSRPLWVRSTAPGAVAMTGRAFGAPERPEPPQLSTERNDNNDEAPQAASRVDDSPHVVEATAVKENEGLPVVYAESSPLSFALLLKERSVRRFLIIGLVIIAIVVISVSVLVVKESSPLPTPPSGPEAEPSPAPSFAPTQMPTFISNDVLQAASLYSHPDDLAREGSPQRNAVGWMSTIDKSGLTVGSQEWGTRYSLVVIYYATGGDTWTERVNWLEPSAHVCDWSPTIFCKNDETLRQRIVQGIDLTDNNLFGRLPPELKNFPFVQYLRFSKNSLTGPLPPDMFTMPIVAVIDIETNQLSGTIPADVGLTSTLAFMDFHSNNFGGTIPTEIFNVTNLNYIDLSLNNMVGTLSTEFGALERLANLNLSFNMFSGSLPDALGSLPKLEFLMMDYNRLTGTLPQWLVQRVSMQEVTLAGNQLTGTVPTLSEESSKYILASYTDDRNEPPVEDIRLKNVDVSDNKLSGTIPVWLGLLQSVKSLKIGGNLFTGNFPFGEIAMNETSYELWSNLEILNISFNKFDAMPLPEEIPGRLDVLDMCGNSYTANRVIPSSYCDHQSLEFLGLSRNPINLPISAVLTCTKDMDDLRTLVMDGSGLTGQITEVLVNDLRELESLNLANNELSGTIPTELFEITTLRSLILSNNTFGGNVPTEIGQVTHLITFWFDYNVRMVGSIPSEMSALTKLESLKQVGNTIMRGSIPEGVCENIRNGPAKFIPTEHIECAIDCSCCGPNRTDYCSGGFRTPGSGRSNPRETSFVRDIFGGGNRERVLRARNAS